jgi:type VI secretion system protein ImpA
MIDVARFLQPTSADPPCGQNLEYDPAFGALERSAEGKPEQVEGNRVISKAEDPAWRDVLEQASALLQRTRDLRVAVHLAHSAMNIEGLPDLAAGLRLIAELQKTYWNEVHPRLDEDGADPTLRLNSLSDLESLPPPGTRQRPTLLRSLERVVLVRSKQAGNYSLRDLKLAKGELTSSATDKDKVPAAPQLALIEAAFQDCDLKELEQNASAAAECVRWIADLRNYLREKVGAERAPEFAQLKKELDAIGRVFAEQLARRGVGQAPPQASEGGPGAENASQVSSSEIRSRDDAVRVLDKVSDYFQKYEPSSPVPLLLQRAKRLVAKDFMEILRDLTPAGVAQAEAIGGIEKRK